MITKEQITINGREFIRTFSDTYKIQKVGTNDVYGEAIDIADYKYTETNELLEKLEVEPSVEEIKPLLTKSE